MYTHVYGHMYVKWVCLCSYSIWASVIYMHAVCRWGEVILFSYYCLRLLVTIEELVSHCTTVIMGDGHVETCLNIPCWPMVSF